MSLLELSAVASPCCFGVRLYCDGARAGLNPVAAGRWQFDLHGIEQMNQEDIAVTGELAKITLELLA